MAIKKKRTSLYLMIAPVIIYFAIFTFYPVVKALIISFQKYSLMGTSKFVGLKNYSIILNDDNFTGAVKNTIIMGLSSAILNAIIAMFIAILLDRVRHVVFKKLSQTIIYIPNLFSWVIVGGIWITILSPDKGLVNNIISAFGGAQVSFWTETSLARPLMVFTNLWKGTGYTAIIYLAAIAGIDSGIYEAAEIDGASEFKQVFYITIPQLMNTAKVVLLLNVMGIFKSFDQIFVMKNGAILDQVNVIMTYVYDKGLGQFNMGVASAASFIIILLTIIIASVVNRLSRSKEEAR